MSWQSGTHWAMFRPNIVVNDSALLVKRNVWPFGYITKHCSSNIVCSIGHTHLMLYSRSKQLWANSACHAMFCGGIVGQTFEICLTSNIRLFCHIIKQCFQANSAKNCIQKLQKHTVLVARTKSLTRNFLKPKFFKRSNILFSFLKRMLPNVWCTILWQINQQLLPARQ